MQGSLAKPRSNTTPQRGLGASAAAPPAGSRAPPLCFFTEICVYMYQHFEFFFLTKQLFFVKFSSSLHCMTYVQCDERERDAGRGGGGGTPMYGMGKRESERDK